MVVAPGIVGAVPGIAGAVPGIVEVADAGAGRTPDGTGAIPGCMGIANVADDAVDGGALPGMLDTGGLDGGVGAAAGFTGGWLLVMAGFAGLDEVAGGSLPMAASSSCIAFD